MSDARRFEVQETRQAVGCCCKKESRPEADQVSDFPQSLGRCSDVRILLALLPGGWLTVFYDSSRPMGVDHWAAFLRGVIVTYLQKMIEPEGNPELAYYPTGTTCE